MSYIQLSNRKIGHDHPCLIIAEAGVNHNGSIKIARQLVKEASLAGADVVKFQTFKADEIVTINSPKAEYQLKTTDNSITQYEMLKSLELSREWHIDLMQHCQNNNIIFLSSPFDIKSIDFLDQIGVSGFKVPSGEIVNLPFLSHLTEKKKPLILSTGMSTLGEVETAIKIIEEINYNNYVLLHCTTNYPTLPEEVNLNAMNTLKSAFQVPVGYSDHTEGIEVSIAAVAMGACVIEKHFTLDKNMSGPDHKASITPRELSKLVKSIRKVEKALGSKRKYPVSIEMHNRKVVRKSIVASKSIKKGEIFTKENLALKRAGHGISSVLWDQILGKLAKKKFEKDELIELF